MSRDEFVWVEKYRPKKIEECILPDNTKKTFLDFLDKGEVPNLLLSGPPGCGKTTVAKALCEQLGSDYYVINGSDEGRFLDTVRNNAKNFASTVSLSSSAKHKVIIIDEADNTTPDVQLCLRAFTEEFIGNCRFIFTCNYKNKIIQPLHSRCSVIDFALKGKEKQLLAGNFFKCLQEILDTEGVEYDNKVLVELIKKHFPDWRRYLMKFRDILPVERLTLVFLHHSLMLKQMISSIVSRLKTFLRSESGWWITWIMILLFFCSVYDACYTSLEGAGVAAAVLIIAKYQYQSVLSQTKK